MRRLLLASLALTAACSSPTGGNTPPPPPPPPPTVASVAVAPGTGTVVVGGITTLTATPRDGAGAAISGKTITWLSSNATIASVSNAGVVTGVSAGGPVTISASTDGKTGSAQITVTAIPVAQVEVTPPTGSIGIAATTQLTATPRDAQGNPLTGRTITWLSANAAIASVSNSGLVTGVSAGGPVNITATVDGIQGSAAITVTAPPPTVVHTTIGVASLSSCALTTQGAAYCWGLGTSGQLGNGTTPPTQLTAVPVNGGHTFIALGVANGTYCGLKANGEVWCWGENGEGTLGIGSTTDQSVPVQITGHVFSSISGNGAGGTMCATKADGSAWCWGRNGGQLGNSGTAASNVPVQSGGPGGYKQVVAGATVTCWLRTDGQAFCAGTNVLGEQGNGTTGGAAVLTPTASAGALRFERIFAGANTVCGVVANGDGWCWGRGESGQLGDGLSVTNSTPVRVSFAGTFARVVPGSSHACGITTGNAAWCWGFSNFIGTGTGTSSFTPAPVTGGASYTEVAATFTHSCGRTVAGAIHCWGGGSAGALGNGGTATQLAPVAVVGMP